MLKVAQVAARLNLSSSRIYEMVEKGEITYHRIGGAIRFTEEAIETLLEETRREHGVRPTKAKQPHPRLKHFRV